ncbi:MAG: hypothetical protein ABIO63_09005 [Casimicrobiaceae bacterium]
MKYKFKVGDWVEVNVDNKNPEWVEVQIKRLVNFSRTSIPAYMFVKEPKPGHGTIYSEVFVRPLVGSGK